MVSVHHQKAQRCVKKVGDQRHQYANSALYMYKQCPYTVVGDSPGIMTVLLPWGGEAGKSLLSTNFILNMPPSYGVPAARIEEYVLTVVYTLNCLATNISDGWYEEWALCVCVVRVFPPPTHQVPRWWPVYLWYPLHWGTPWYPRVGPLLVPQPPC